MKTSPKEILKQWVVAFNAADADKLAGFYHNDAVNHQVANEPVLGKEAIKTMFRNEFSQAKWYVLWKISLKTESGEFLNGKIR